jgi:hypothetical protein
VPGDELVTRKTLRRELIQNAATKPVAISTGAVVAIAGFLLHTIWLLPIAIAVYLALALATLFDSDEAKRVGDRTYARSHSLRRRPRIDDRRFSPEIASLLDQAQVEEERIRDAIAQAKLPLTDVSVEVDALMKETERIAQKAQLVMNYLAQQDADSMERRRRELMRAARDTTGETRKASERAASAVEEQLRVRDALVSELDRFYAEMEHVVASLGVVHGDVVRMSVADERSMQDDLAGRVRDLRERVGTLAGGIDEAMGRVSTDDPAQPAQPS